MLAVKRRTKKKKPHDLEPLGTDSIMLMFEDIYIQHKYPHRLRGGEGGGLEMIKGLLHSSVISDAKYDKVYRAGIKQAGAWVQRQKCAAPCK